MKIFRVVLTGEEPPHYTITEAFKKRFEQVDTLYWDEIKDLNQMNSIAQGRVKDIQYDAVFMQIQHPNIISQETARVLSEHTLAFNWTGDVRTDITWYKQIAPYVVTLFTNMTDVEKIRDMGYRAEYLQTGYDHKYYFQKQLDRYNNIAFCANYYPEANFPLTQERVNAVHALKQNFPDNFNLYGLNWHKIQIKSEGKANNELEALLYNKCTLALNLSHFNYSRYFSDRMLREMACGCCVLSHRFQNCDLEFSENVHIVYWDSINELIEKCRYYMAHPEEARKIGDAAAEYVKENYSWDRFTENLENIIKNHGSIYTKV